MLGLDRTETIWYSNYRGAHLRMFVEGEKTLKRIYTYYSDQEFEKICNKALLLGITPSQLVKTIVLENFSTFTFNKDIIDMEKIIVEMKDRFNAFETEKPFIVSDLVNGDIWKKLTRSQKMTLSLHLKKIAEASNTCEVLKIINNTKMYQKRSD